MKTITPEIVERKRDAHGRTMTSPEQRQAVVNEYRQSGLTQKEFAAREGLKLSTFTSWMRKSVGAPARPTPAVHFAQVNLPVRVSLEVQLPDGTILRGGSAAELANLLKELKRC